MNIEINRRDIDDAPNSQAEAWSFDSESLQFDLSHLNSESQKPLETEKTIESSTLNIDQLKEGIDRIYAESGRDTTNVVSRKEESQNLNVIYFEDYGASFSSYRGDDSFIARPNEFKTDSELQQELKQEQSKPRERKTADSLRKLGNAIIGRIAA